MKFLNKIAVLTLLLLNVSLILASLLTNWGKFDDSKSFALLSCKNCGDFKNDWNFECLARTACGEEGEECEFYEDLYRAGYAYCSLELASLLMAWIFLVKICLFLTDHYPGPKVIIVIAGILMLIFHISGIILWFSFSQAGLKCESTDFDSRPGICIERGPVLALSNVFLMMIGLVWSFNYIRREELPLRVEIFPGRFLWVSGRSWSWISLTLALAYTIFLFASLSVNDWIHQDDYQGSLSRCKDCEDIEWLSWKCLSSEQCEINDSSSSCQEFKKLSTAGDVYFVLQGLCMFFLAYFLQCLTSFINNTLHGTPNLNYFIAGILSITNLISILYWFLKSDSKLICSESEPCGSLGAQLSVVSNFFIFPSTLIFFLTFYKRVEVQMSQTIDLRHYNSIALSKDASLNLDETNLAKVN